MKRILIIDKAHPLLVTGLEKMRWQVDYKPDIKPETVVENIGDYTGLIMNSKIRAEKDFLDRASQLKFIGRLGSGLEIIDAEYAKSKGIHVFNTPEGNRNAVAEHTIGMILSLMNHLQQADREVRSFQWNREKHRGNELSGKTLGIIGFGNTGSALANKLHNWDIEILTYDPYRKEYGNFPYVKPVNLMVLQENADIISFHVPLNEETHYYFNAEFSERCKKGVIIVNTSRGAVVCTRDLIAGLEKEHISGACLDVLENEHPEQMTDDEKIMYNQLFGYNQVIFSPHVAGWTFESLEKIAKAMLVKIESLKIE